MIRFDLRESSFASSRQQLASLLETTPTEPLMPFPEKIGAGYLFTTEIEPGLYIRVWNFKAPAGIEFCVPAKSDEEPPMIKACYFLDPGNTWVGAGPMPPLRHSVFTNHTAYTIRCLPPSIRIVTVCLTKDWLSGQWTEWKEGEVSIQHIPSSQPFLGESYRIIKEVVEKTARQDYDNIFLKAKILTLVHTLIGGIREGYGPRSPHGAYPADRPDDIMQRVEARICAAIREKLPNLKDLAREFNFSESTLKRRFRAAYNSTLYDYYLHKKMEWARHMLLHEQKSITEAAYFSGYDNVSHFIKMFKKHYGHPPAHWRASQGRS